jgi:hypothetical protein
MKTQIMNLKIMNLKIIKKLSFSLAFSAIFSAMFFVFMASDTSAQPNPPDILGRSDKWLFGDLHLEKLYGEIGSATPGAEFGTDTMLIILRQIDGRITELEGTAITGDTVYQLIVSDLFGFNKVLTEESYQVFIPMPDGYRIKPGGVFDASIAGWDEYSNRQVIYGPGYMVAGFLFTRDDHPYLAGWTVHGFVQLQPWTPYEYGEPSGGELALPIDLGIEKIGAGDRLTF